MAMSHMPLISRENQRPWAVKWQWARSWFILGCLIYHSTSDTWRPLQVHFIWALGLVWKEECLGLGGEVKRGWRTDTFTTAECGALHALVRGLAMKPHTWPSLELVSCCGKRMLVAPKPSICTGTHGNSSSIFCLVSSNFHQQTQLPQRSTLGM